jgi:hypothetical protein
MLRDRGIRPGRDGDFGIQQFGEPAFDGVNSVFTIEPLRLQVSSRWAPAVLELDTVARGAGIRFGHRSFTPSVAGWKRLLVRAHSIANLELSRPPSASRVPYRCVAWHGIVLLFRDSTAAICRIADAVDVDSTLRSSANDSYK